MCLENALTAVDSSVSIAIKKANVIFLTKNSVDNEKNIQTKIIKSNFNDETGTVTFGQRLWKKCGFFLSKLPISICKRLTFLRAP